MYYKVITIYIIWVGHMCILQLSGIVFFTIYGPKISFPPNNFEQILQESGTVVRFLKADIATLL